MTSKFMDTYRKNNSKVKEIPGLKLNRPLYTGNVPLGTLGIELEMEGRGLINTDGAVADLSGSSTGARWSAKHDGSLRNGGIEYVLTTPCSVAEIDPLVTGLFDKLKLAGSRIENSNRCSTHVHVNVGAQRINKLTSIIVLWGIFEEFLIRWHGVNRTRNHFCLSFKDSKTTLNSWLGMLRNGQFPNQDSGAKYSALNILPLWRFGSFEFRCGQEPDDPAKVILWGKFLHYLVQYAVNKYENPNQIAYDISDKTAIVLLEEICSQDPALLPFYKEIINGETDRSFNEGCMESFRSVQALCYEFPWDDWLPVIGKEYIPNPFAKQPRVAMW